MNWQDYMTIGVVALNLVSNLRHRKFTMQAFEKALFNNRRLLGKTLTDIAKSFATESKAPEVKVSQPIEDAELVPHE